MSGRLLFQCGPQQLHMGGERDFRPAKKAHPAFVADDLEALRQVFLLGGVKITDDHSLPGTRRFFVEDPWGNRLEFVAALLPTNWLDSRASSSASATMLSRNRTHAFIFVRLLRLQPVLFEGGISTLGIGYTFAPISQANPTR
jgi:hypothetical protein